MLKKIIHPHKEKNKINKWPVMPYGAAVAIERI